MASARVLLVSADFPPFLSGVGDYVDKLAAALQAAGADVTVLTGVSSDPGDANRSFRVLRSIAHWGLNQRKAIVAACRQEYDVVHLQYPGLNYGRGPMINLLPVLLRMSGPIPRTVLTVHDFRVMRRRWRARAAPDDLGRGRVDSCGRMRLAVDPRLGRWPDQAAGAYSHRGKFRAGLRECRIAAAMAFGPGIRGR